MVLGAKNLASSTMSTRVVTCSVSSKRVAITGLVRSHETYMISPKASAAPSRWCPVASRGRAGARRTAPRWRRSRRTRARSAATRRRPSRSRSRRPGRAGPGRTARASATGRCSRPTGRPPAATSASTSPGAAARGSEPGGPGGVRRPASATGARGAVGLAGPMRGLRTCVSAAWDRDADRAVSIDHASHARLPGRQFRRGRAARGRSSCRSMARAASSGPASASTPTRPAELGELGEPDGPADHDRAAGGERLHHRDRVRLVVAEQRHHRGAGDASRPSRAVGRRHEPDRRRGRRRRALGQARAARPRRGPAEDLHAGVGAGPEQVRQRLDQPVVALVALEPTDADDQARLGRRPAPRTGGQGAAVADHGDRARAAGPSSPRSGGPRTARRRSARARGAAAGRGPGTGCAGPARGSALKLPPVWKVSRNGVRRRIAASIASGGTRVWTPCTWTRS